MHGREITKRRISARQFSRACLLVTSLALFCSCALGPSGGSASQGFLPPPDPAPQEANSASLNPQSWNIYYSAGMPAHPSADPEGAWSFEFPQVETGGHVNYVQTPFRATTTPHNVILTFKVESDAPEYVVLDTTDILPATVHLFFEQQNDNLVDPDGRWWAHPSMYNLGSQDGQTITYTIPFTYDQWSNVDGQQDPVAFAAAWQNVGWIGVTFGGQFFWGHGVALAGGSARYILISLSVN